MTNTPVLSIQTPQNVTIEYELASVGERILAIAIDMVILFGTFYGMGELIDSITKTMYTRPGAWIYILLMGPIILYPFFFELFNNGQTIGKIILKIKVIKTDGSQPGVSSYLTRWLFLLIDFSIIIALADVFFMLFTPNTQRIGDMIAGTAVIRLRYKTKFEDTIFRNVKEDYVPAFHQVLNLKDRDINIIDEILRNHKRADRVDRMQKVAVKLQKVLKIKTDLTSEEFLSRILEDYNHLTGKDHE